MAIDMFTSRKPNDSGKVVAVVATDGAPGGAAVPDAPAGAVAASSPQPELGVDPGGGNAFGALDHASGAADAAPGHELAPPRSDGNRPDEPPAEPA
jgi:hypothetical protein